MTLHKSHSICCLSSLLFLPKCHWFDFHLHLFYPVGWPLVSTIIHSCIKELFHYFFSERRIPKLVKWSPNSLWSATTRLSLHGISSHATTRCGCLEIATTRNFALFWILKSQNALRSFFALSERFRSFSLTCYVYINNKHAHAHIHIIFNAGL